MDERLDEALWRERTREALSRAALPEAELYLRATHRGVARLARGRLEQHVSLEELTAVARVAHRTEGGVRVASASSTEGTPEALLALLQEAAQLAQHAPFAERWPGLAEPEASPSPLPPRYGDDACVYSAQTRADAVRPALERARAAGLHAAGSLDARASVVCAGNTRGVLRSQRLTMASLRVFALDEGCSGFAQRAGRDARALACDDVAQEAVERALASRDPVTLEPGAYDVLLEPPAVAELLEWLAFTAFTARAVHEGTSPLAGRRGERLTGAAVTLTEDALGDTEWHFGAAFDREGEARRRVELVREGLAGECARDRRFGLLLGSSTTGHASAPGELEDAPCPVALRMEPGALDTQALLARLGRGLHITRFHYVNGFLDPRNALMTGMTRDGTFRIEGGRRVGAARNMRFTDRVFEAFSRIDGLGSALQAVCTPWWNPDGAFVAPAVLVRGLRFSSSAG